MKTKPQVLIVDDSLPYCDILAFLLPCPANVDVACDAESALALLRQKQYDLALVDVRLKEDDEGNTDGLRVLREGQAVSPRTAFILTSAYAETEVRLGALGAGARHFIQKPYHADELQRAVRETLDRR